MRLQLRPLQFVTPLLAVLLTLVLAPGLCAQPPKKQEAASKKATQVSPKRKPPASKVAQKRPKKKKVDQELTYANNPAALQAAKSIAKAQQLDPAWVHKTLAQARFLPSVVRAVTPPAQPGSRDWAAYRARVVTPQRIEAGAAFMRTHAATLARAEAQYGVPPSIVAGILGVETIYGRNMGQYRVLDALATLAFDFPVSHPKKASRQAYFLSELEAFFAFCHSNGYDPLALRGSYAGAMGMGQFMPSSWLHYAVDFDGSGRIDLFNSTADAIGSVAHYFSIFHWKRGMPTHYALAADALPADLTALLEPDIVPSFTPQQLEERGVALSPAARNHVGLLALVALPMGESAAPHYVLGTDNFYAITRYNWSSQYAMAVIDLAQAIEAAAQTQP
jgi:membrane-bound lytic murein transglycosylase B